MWLHYPRPLLLLTSFLLQILSSSANTEIINLTPSLSHRIPTLDLISSDWPVLTPVGGQNERRWAMTHVPQEGDAEGCIGKREWCEDDLWLVLDFDAEEWNPYRGFTLRVSWPGSVCHGYLSIRLVSGVEFLLALRKYILTRRKPSVSRFSPRSTSSWRRTHRKITPSKPAMTRHGPLTSHLPILRLETCTLGSDPRIPAS